MQEQFSLIHISIQQIIDPDIVSVKNSTTIFPTTMMIEARSNQRNNQLELTPDINVTTILPTSLILKASSNLGDHLSGNETKSVTNVYITMDKIFNATSNYIRPSLPMKKNSHCPWVCLETLFEYIQELRPNLAAVCVRLLVHNDYHDHGLIFPNISSLEPAFFAKEIYFKSIVSLKLFLKILRINEEVESIKINVPEEPNKGKNNSLEVVSLLKNRMPPINLFRLKSLDVNIDEDGKILLTYLEKYCRMTALNIFRLTCSLFNHECHKYIHDTLKDNSFGLRIVSVKSYRWDKPLFHNFGIDLPQLNQLEIFLVRGPNHVDVFSHDAFKILRNISYLSIGGSNITTTEMHTIIKMKTLKSISLTINPSSNHFNLSSFVSHFPLIQQMHVDIQFSDRNVCELVGKEDITKMNINTTVDSNCIF